MHWDFGMHALVKIKDLSKTIASQQKLGQNFVLFSRFIVLVYN